MRHLYLTIRIGTDPESAIPILASTDAAAIRAAARALVDALDFELNDGLEPVLALHREDDEP